MRLRLHFKTALRNLTASPLRSFLAMLGITVGTASVVALMSGGTLATQQALEQIKTLGTDLMRIDFNASNMEAFQKVPLEKIKALQTSIPGVLLVAPIGNLGASLKYKQKTIENTTILGSSADLAEIIHISMKEGRFIHNLDKSQAFCVIGSNIALQLPSIEPIGTNLRFENAICKIIGIANSWPENNIVGYDINKSVILPLGYLNQMSSTSVNTALLRLSESADIDVVKKEINEYFNKNIPNFTVNIQSAKELLRSINKQQTIFTLLLGLIGGISLLVGGIGVMNIMLASVAERHSEIGLRIALGATPRDVQIMFLIEATTLAILGGGMGVVLGIFATVTIAYFAHWNFIILFSPPLIGFSVSLLISLFFGFYPAYIASRLNPIETLRS